MNILICYSAVLQNLLLKATLKYLQSLSAEGAPKQLTDLAASGYGGSVKDLAALSAASDLWGTVKKRAPSKVVEIKPVERGETNKLASEIQTYNKGVVSYHKLFKQKPVFWAWETDVKDAVKSLEETRREFQGNQTELNKQLHMASMFDLTDLTKDSQTLMAECDENLTSMSLLWAVVKTLRTSYEEQKTVLWADLDAGELEDEVKQYQKKMNRLPKVRRARDVTCSTVVVCVRCGVFVCVSVVLLRVVSHTPHRYALTASMLQSPHVHKYSYTCVPPLSPPLSSPKSVRESKALMGLKNNIKDQLNTIPLIQALAHNSMRPRYGGTIY